MAKTLLDAIYGSLIASAIGDALGAPVEGWYWTEIRETYGHVTELMPSDRANTGINYGGADLPAKAGWVTDDTTMRHYLCLAIARKQGRITPDDYAAVLLEKFNPNRVWVNERSVVWKLRAGVNPWDSGKGTIPAGCATMAISPIGIINAGDPAQAYQDGFNIAFVNQDNHNRDGAATMAAGVAAAFLPDATVASVLETMTRYSADLIRRAIDLTMDLATASEDVDDFAERYYATMLDWTWPSLNWNKEHFFSGNSIELIPITMAILHLCGDDVNRAMIEAASFGRDCDTTASMVGALLGAMRGAEAVRQDWIETVETVNADFFKEVGGAHTANFYAMAQRLEIALRVEREAARARLALLDAIVGD